MSHRFVSKPNKRSHQISALVIGSLLLAVSLIAGPPSSFASSQTPALVKDINLKTSDSDFYPDPFVTFNGFTYFSADDKKGGGYALWKTDGTSAGTTKVKDINPSSFGGEATSLNVLNGKLYFVADDGTHGNELWTTDGTEAGTVLVKDINPTGSSSPSLFTQVGDILFFTADDGTTGIELWKTDGTTAGTQLVRDIRTGDAGNYDVGPLVAFDGFLFMAADDGTNGTELWKSDGLALGTVLVKDINPGALSGTPSNFAVYGSNLYFSASEPTTGIELWKTDGTSNGTALLKDINTNSDASVPRSSTPSQLVAAHGLLYFTAENGTSSSSRNRQLWVTDGTSANTRAISSTRNPGAGAEPDWLTPVGSLLFFAAWDVTNGSNDNELWVWNGTTSQRVKNLNPATSSAPTELTVVNGSLYFSANDGSVGSALWKSDGTEAGTTLVKDVLPGTSSAGYPDFTYLTAAANNLLFVANDGFFGRELWVSDGSAEGTNLLKDFNDLTQDALNDSQGPEKVVIGEEVIFVASDGRTGTELWKTDGTESGTSQVKDVRPGSSSSSRANLTLIGSEVFFRASDGSTGTELWKSDGTSAGTLLVKDIRAGSSSSSVSQVTAVGSTLYFSADDGTNGAELWKSDGTTGGTVLVKDIYPGSDSSWISDLTAVGSTLFFVADDGVNGTELWKSDGTSNGTILVKDIIPGSSSSSISRLTAVGSTVYFRANDGTNGTELWKSDGTSNGTVLVKDIHQGSDTSDPQNPTANSSDPENLVAVGPTLYFSAFDPINGTELWKSDGTSAGTSLVKDINPGSNGSSISEIGLIGSTLFFGASDGTNGTELWKSDGTSAGTTLVRDINSSGSSNPSQLTAVGDILYLAATDGISGEELWRTDGTSVGTVQVADLNPGSSSSNPLSILGFGDFVLFAADDGTVGHEWWRLGSLESTDDNFDNPGDSSRNNTPIVVDSKTPARPIASEVIRSFSPDSARITAAQRSLIRKAVRSHRDSQRLVCIGATSGQRVDSFNQRLATNRARAVCDLAKRINPELRTSIKIRPSLGVSEKNRKVIMRFHK